MHYLDFVFSDKLIGIRERKSNLCALAANPELNEITDLFFHMFKIIFSRNMKKIIHFENHQET